METCYQLSRTIAVHTDDVRSVCFAGSQLVSTSRDGSAKMTNLATSETCTLVDSDVYLNASAFDKEKFVCYVGSHDGVIVGTEVVAQPNMDDQIYLLGHTANCSCLATCSNFVASGSWDHTVRLWRDTETVGVISDHKQNVWAVQFVNNEYLLTAGADKCIYLYKLHSASASEPVNIKKVCEFNGHSDAVRGLAVLTPEVFASVSNDMTLRLWSTNGECLCKIDAHTSFVYSVVKISDKLLATAGEDRTVRIWEYTVGPNATLKPVQTIVLPSVSQWCLSVNDSGDLAVGSSDNTVHIFTLDAAKLASETELKEFNDKISNSAIQQNEVDEKDVQNEEVLKNPGKQEGQVVMVRDSKSGKVGAYQYSGSQWTHLGEVVGQNQESGSNKQEYNGKTYDYVFDVDIADGQPPLRLPYNNSDNVYATAEQFVTDNSLPTSYIDQIVQFLIRNSQSTQLDSAPAAPAAPAASTTSAPAQSTSNGSGSPNFSGEIPSELKYSTLHALKAYNADGIIGALNKICAKRSVPQNFEPLICSLPSSSNELLTTSLSTIDSWQDNIEDLLPVYDLLRVSVYYATNVPYTAVWTKLLIAIDASLPKHTLLVVRAMVNLAQRPDFQTDSNKKMLDQAIEMISANALPSSKPLAVALSTLFLNLAVVNFDDLDLSRLALRTAAVGVNVDAEAVYRFTLALGIRCFHSSSRELGQLSSAWRNASVNTTEPRVKAIADTINQRM